MTNHSDSSLLEMFRDEMETHMAVLNDGLLALERDPTQSHRFEGLMRAAHSIKGAAKIVGLSAVVQIAHAIEDSFVAAREGRLEMTSQLVDVLFAGVDVLGRVGQVDAPDSAPGPTAEVRDVVEKIVRTSAENPSAVLRSKSGREITQAVKPESIFRPRGNLNADWVKAHHRDVATALSSEQGQIRFDLVEVDSVDPIGLALLQLAAQESAKRNKSQDAAIRFEGASPRLAQLLWATGLVPYAAAAAET